MMRPKPHEKQEGPQVLADLTGGWKIISDVSISQNELVAMLCDGDSAEKHAKIQNLREWTPLENLVRWPYVDTEMLVRS